MSTLPKSVIFCFLCSQFESNRAWFFFLLTEKEAKKSTSESGDTNSNSKMKVPSESPLRYELISENDEDLVKRENRSNVTQKSPSGILNGENDKQPANKGIRHLFK